MFTGIIQEIGIIKEIKNDENWFYITIGAQKLIHDLKLGASIAIDGVCLTVVEFDLESFRVQLMPETLKMTNFQNAVVGTKVNLEPALKIGDTLDGHFVMGHVDGVGKVIDLISNLDNWIIRIQPPQELMQFIAHKGSIAVNGTSLTVSKTIEDSFEISLIKHTLENTILGDLKIDSIVNLEVDMFARYITNYISKK